MAIPSPRRLDFEPDIISTAVASNPDEAPALSSSRALARFEFESGKGNEGTKILMVEWSDSDGSNNMGDWEVSWEGKTTVLSARDGAEGKLHRLYFLLAPGANIPRIVKLSQAGSGEKIQTNPLPAIFPPELGLSATTQGRKGVLHTVWAKQRLSVLQKEIEIEMKNGEGVGLEMAMQEKQWIEDNFGVGSKVVPDQPNTASPTSPKFPGSGRLSEKLKGLKLGTSISQLGPSDEPSLDGSHLMSPDLGDIAVSSFSQFHGAAPRPRIAAKTHPRNNSQISSIDAIASGQVINDIETEDGLFAVKMSPRSPEMTKSPFSFTSKHAAPWAKSNE